MADPLDLAQRSRFAWACELRDRCQHGNCVRVTVCRGHLSSMATGTAAPILLATGNQKGSSWRHSRLVIRLLVILRLLQSLDIIHSFVRSFVPSFVRSLFTHLLTPSHTSFITNFIEFSFERFSTYLNTFRAIFSRLKLTSLCCVVQVELLDQTPRRSQPRPSAWKDFG